ncbi:MAG: [FeFe] hydrogenase H-cluster radical SAM maturase HydG [Treponema sp.]|jgi:2-iminoacetate synthase|nr:[FeFe] hydrogenase H-cluster radical SAM maturase HydG [Treponema sp.]
MYIDNSYIENLLKQAKMYDNAVSGILDKAERLEGLSHEEVAQLLVCEDEKYILRIFEIAHKIKKHIYGNRIVLFAPLYVSDYCVNQCAYCNYNHNHRFERRRLTMEQVREEVAILEKMGHKRLALEAGEDDDNCPIEYVLECLDTIYKMKTENGEIRRVNVNIAATTVENYKKLKEAGIGTYILFQETYHRAAYEKAHIAGPKKDYDYHITAFDRAMEAGIDDVGGGVLFGLYDPYFDTLALMLHNEYLEKKYNVGFHTVSIPRICKADGAVDSGYKYALDDKTFLKIAAILRIAIPFTGIIISTRESPEMRKKLIHAGISQISGGSSTGVRGYSKSDKITKQFEINDDRKTSEIIKWLMDENMVPSFCTACYRNGRTGDYFMSIAKSGEIKNVCLPNALMTLCEYACDYGDNDLTKKADAIIEKELSSIENEKVRALIAENIKKIKNGERDLFI